MVIDPSDPVTALLDTPVDDEETVTEAPEIISPVEFRTLPFNVPLVASSANAEGAKPRTMNEKTKPISLFLIILIPSFIKYVSKVCIILLCLLNHKPILGYFYYYLLLKNKNIERKYNKPIYIK